MKAKWKRVAESGLRLLVAVLALWWWLSWYVGEDLLYEAMVPDLRKAHVEGTVLCAGSSVFLSYGGAEKFVDTLEQNGLEVEMDPGGYCTKIWEDPKDILKHPYRLWVGMERRWDVLVWVHVATGPVQVKNARSLSGQGYRGWYLFVGYRWIPLKLEFWIA